MPDNLAEMNKPIDLKKENTRLNALCVSLEEQRNNALNVSANNRSDFLLAQNELKEAREEIAQVSSDLVSLQGKIDKKEKPKKNSSSDSKENLAKVLRPN